MLYNLQSDEHDMTLMSTGLVRFYCSSGRREHFRRASARYGQVRYGYNWRPPQVVAKVPALLHVVIQSAGILRESFHLGRGAQKHHIHFLLCTFPSPTPSSKPLSLLITHYTDNRSHSQPSSWVSPTSFPRLASPVCCWFSAASCRCAKNHTVLDNWVKTRSYIVG